MVENSGDLDGLIAANQPAAGNEGNGGGADGSGGNNNQGNNGGADQGNSGAANTGAEAGGNNAAPQIPEGYFNLKEVFGETITDVAGAKGHLTELTEKATREVKPAYADEEVGQYDNFVRETKIKDFGLFNKIKGFDSATADPLDKLVMQAIIKNPKFIGFEEKIKADLINKYKVNDQLESDDDLRYNRIKLEEDAEEAGKSISSLKENFGKFSAQATDNTKTEALGKLREAWKPTIEGIDQSFKKVETSVTIGEGDSAQVHNIVYDVPAELMAQIKPEVQQFIEMYNIENNANGLAAVKEFMENRAIIANKKAYLASVVSQTIVATTKAIQAGIHNPHKPGQQQENRADGELTFEEASKRAMAD